MPSHILSIDQGTTSTRAVVYNSQGQPVGSGQREFTQHFPQPGWVEHDAEEIWQTVAAVVPEALAEARVEAKDLAGIGLTNQRETVVIWDRSNGRPVHKAIVWQDRRTSDFCRDRKGDEPWLRERTGLVLDPYFSGTKLRWMLQRDAALKSRAERGQLACGTIDSFLIWRLTGGKVHATDVTNASRTLLLNLHTTRFDEELCDYFGVPVVTLPCVQPSSAEYGVTAGLNFLPDGLRITGVAGDQQAALFGQCAFEPGEAKCTYGTGAFFLQHIGTKPTLSKHGLVTTLAATMNEHPLYALEGSVFVAGAAVQWLRDGLKLFKLSSEIEGLANQSDPEQPVLFVPAFVGLGAPYWVPEARGVIFGLTRGTNGADLARAALEGVAYQVADLIEAAGNDAGQPLKSLRVDGGMSRNAKFLQYQSDVLGIEVLQAQQSESTALGAAYLAGLKVGVWPSLAALRRLASTARPFQPQLQDEERARRLKHWQRAVAAVKAFYQPHA